MRENKLNKKCNFVIFVYTNQVQKLFAWRIKTSDMDTPGVLVAGSGVKEVIKNGILFLLFMCKI